MYSMNPLRTTIAAIGLSGLLVHVSACDSRAGTGPLSIGGDTGVLCASIEPGETLVIGEVVVAGAPVEIQSLSLKNATGFDQVDSSVMQLDPSDAAIGAFPLDQLEGGVGEEADLWATRVDAVGAQLREGVTYSVTVTVSSQGADGSASAMVIDYESDGREYSATGTVSYEFGSVCQ